MRDSIAAAYRAALADVQRALDVHVRQCHDCSKAKAARQARHMCRVGWRFVQVRRACQQTLDDHLARQRELEQQQVTLFGQA